MIEKEECSESKDEQRACAWTAPDSTTSVRGQKTPVLPV